jgi:CTP synthase (UTP-ammonia lyase)
MANEIVIGLVGDRRASVPAHAAIPLAFERIAAAFARPVTGRWIASEAAESSTALTGLHGVWCVPGGPYNSLAGALAAIRFARENRVPFLGTCAGFQHAVLEYARNALGWTHATHAEAESEASETSGATAVITPLSCGVLAGEGAIRLVPGSRLATAYGADVAREEYLCSYGVNPEFRAALAGGPLREAATDAQGDLRAVELRDHPFFVATLFQPERAALKDRPAPLVEAFVRACAG